MTEKQKVVTRFAPSPTGFMHVGNLRTGLFAWLIARHYDGTFILRIEDTDKKREVAGSIEHIQKTLKWIGLNWDEGPDMGGPNGPYIQSERLKELNVYERYAKILIEKGLAYADPFSEEEVENFRKQAETEKRPYLYRDHRPENPPQWQAGLPLRFKVTDLKRTIWNDLVRGKLSAGAEQLDDFILIKADGYPTYNFAHIVDDIEMSVTHVIRGQEFISSTPNYLALYEALSIKPPLFLTAPPILNDDGNKKMGKREGAKDALDYSKDGFLPETMFNFLAFLGWNPGDTREVMSREEIIETFQIEKIHKAGAKWNDDKLNWLNKEHMKRMPKEKQEEEIYQKILEIPEISKSEKIQDKDYLAKIYPIIFDRISKWSDILTMAREGELSFFFEEPEYEADKLIWKDSGKEEILKNLNWVLNTINSVSDEDLNDPEKVKALLFAYATENGKGQVLWPTRMSLSGRDKSPDPFTLIYILGKEETVNRLEKAIEKLS